MSQSFVSRDAGQLRSRLAESLPVSLWTHWRLYAAGAAATVAAAAWLFGSAGFTQATQQPEESLPRATATTAVARATEAVVQVSGAVERAGVVRLSSGARVSDAVDAAGGLSSNADLDRINLAAKVIDGQRIYIVARGQDAPPAATGAQDASNSDASGQIDLNSATIEALDKLPGVGPATAKAIVDYRTAHGQFRSVDDLGKVKGIGPAKLEQIKPLVTT